jgi:hypothetical protein
MLSLHDREIKNGEDEHLSSVEQIYKECAKSLGPTRKNCFFSYIANQKTLEIGHLNSYS